MIMYGINLVLVAKELRTSDPGFYPHFMLTIQILAVWNDKVKNF